MLAGVIGETNPFLSVAFYLFLIDWSALFPWQALLLGSAVLTVLIVVELNWAHGVASRARTEAMKQQAAFRRTAVEYLVRLRFVCTVLYLLLAGGQVLLFFNSQDCRVPIPANVQAWVDTIYGSKAPNQRHCQWPNRP
jgi:hypothetical protein